MNIKNTAIFAALIASLGAGSAMAADLYVANGNLPVETTTTAPRQAVRVVAVDEYQANLNSAQPAPSRVLRAQVRAETLEAQKLGLIVTGEMTPPAATPGQLALIRIAGQRAVNHQLALN